MYLAGPKIALFFCVCIFVCIFVCLNVHLPLSHTQRQLYFVSTTEVTGSLHAKIWQANLVLHHLGTENVVHIRR